jgi:Pretoxin HINT domain
VIDKPECKRSRPFAFAPVLLASAWVALGAYLIAGASDARGRSAQPSVELGSVHYQASRSKSAPPDLVARGRAIQDVRVGDRVLTHLDEREPGQTVARGVLRSSEPSLDAEEVDQGTWRRVDLTMPESPGGDLEIVLLRPSWWVSGEGAERGRTINLDLPEMGAVGAANVVSVGPCAPLKTGRGRVVTGTFTHAGATVLDVGVEGLDNPVGATPMHPFYSADRRRYVAAKDLVAGERLLTSGGEARVTCVVRRPGKHRVHNLEVHRDHVYRVTRIGVLVHNTSPAGGYTPDQQALQQLINEATNGGRTPLSTQQAETVLDWAQELR